MTNDLAIKILTGDVLGTTEQTHEAVAMAVKALSALPSADAVEVVRCKDCRYFNNTFPLLQMCNISGMKMETDDYCSYGEVTAWRDRQ